MNVTFLEPRDTINYGPVAVGETIEVSAADGAAFIAAGVAKRAGGASISPAEEVASHE